VEIDHAVGGAALVDRAGPDRLGGQVRSVCGEVEFGGLANRLRVERALDPGVPAGELPQRRRIDDLLGGRPDPGELEDVRGLGCGDRA
jgi:hypothetical protein